MKKVIIIAILLFPAALFAQEEEVKNTFEEFKSAMTGGNSGDVLALASSSSVEYYDDLLDLILYADSS